MRRAIGALVIGAVLAAVPAAAAPAPTRSTLSPGWDHTQPRWSPGGRALLVQASWVSVNWGAWYRLLAVGLDGRTAEIGRLEQRELEEWDFDGEWSPSGNLVAFTRNVGLGEAHYLYVSGAGGAGQRRLSGPGERDDSSPMWAPDGRRIAFVRGSAGGPRRIATVGVDGGDERVLTSGNDGEPRWSPDGRWIAFLRAGRTSGSEAVFAVRPDGSDLRRLTPDGDYRLGRWSPDSTRLAAVSGPDRGDDTIVVVALDGSPPRRVGRGTAPDWSPDGRRFAFFRADGLYVVSSGGGAATRVYRFRDRAGVNDAAVVAPAWSPGGRSLAFAQTSGCIAYAVYVLDLGTRRARGVSNDCHLKGTARADRLRGTHERDVVVAGPGDDVVEGNPGNRRNEYHGRYDRDDLDGGPGADRLFGRRDLDFLRGGPGADLLDGGTGPDRNFGGPGADVILARDGYRDRIVCGPGYDRVVADRADLVARDCERVERRPA